MERLVRELGFERLALADVAGVEQDAADVLVVDEVREQDLELAGVAVAGDKGAFERLNAVPGGYGGDARASRSRSPADARRSNRCRARSSGDVAQDALDRRALVAHRRVGLEHGDEVARMAHERREAGLAPPPVHLLAQHRAVEGECDLGRERAQCRALGLGVVARARDQHDRGAGAPRRERRRAARGCAWRQPGGERLGRRQAHSRLAACHGAVQPPGSERCPARRHPSSHRRRRRATLRCHPAAQRDRRTGTRERGGRAYGHLIDLPAGRGGDELGTRAAERALALERAVLLAHEPGHANDDEPEQRDRRDADDGVIKVAGAQIVDDADRGRHEGRAGEQAQPERG